MKSEDVLVGLLQLLEMNLEELSQVDDSAFIIGERMAYIECFEVAQRWNGAAENGFTWDVEERYPIEKSRRNRQLSCSYSSINSPVGEKT